WLLHAFQELSRAMRPEWTKTLQDLGLRLQHGVKEELLPLIRLRGVGRIRARALRAAGFAKPADLKGVPISRLANIPGIGDKLALDLRRQVGDDPDAEAPEPAATPPKKGKGQSSVLDFGEPPA
ncbi:MAG: ATP-dependent helicase, partial [Thermoplasmata archaeon]|nr:ATP-dependent helicase [Thermoplasmata archaeon]